MFALTVAKNQLITPLLTVAGAVDKKPESPILGNIFLRVANNLLTLSATDLKIEISALIVGDWGEASGDITVPAKKFIDIIRTLEEAAIAKIHLESDTVIIKAGRSLFKLATLPAIDFPASTQEVNEVELSISRTGFLRLLQSTQFAIPQQEVRIFLNGLLVEFNTQNITAVASDGHRMAISKLDCEKISAYQRFLLPRRAVQEILKLLMHVSDDSISIAAGKNHFIIGTKDYTLKSRLVEARFPPYNQAIPKHQDKWITLESEVLKRALTRMVILSNEKSRAVMLKVETAATDSDSNTNENELEAVITLIANNQEKDEATESIEAHTNKGTDLKIGINATYLLDALNFVNEGLVKLSMSTPEAGILFESLQDKHYQYIIMPMIL